MKGLCERDWVFVRSIVDQEEAPSSRSMDREIFLLKMKAFPLRRAVRAVDWVPPEIGGRGSNAKAQRREDAEGKG